MNTKKVKNIFRETSALVWKEEFLYKELSAPKLFPYAAVSVL